MPERVAARTARARMRAKSAGLLAVDVGNSETVVGLFRGPDLAGFWRLTSRPLTMDEAFLQLQALRAQAGGWPATTAAVLCSVAPQLTGAWQGALRRALGEPALEVNAASASNLRIRYRDKSAVGADRIANALGARKHYGTPAIVVDLGTATTFDCLSRSGAYLGGVIAPGVLTSSEELFRRAARLGRVELRRPPRALGQTTEESLQSGVLYGAAGQVDALVRRLALEMKGTPHVIATGGLASIIAPECETINVVDESLTLKGMKVLWEERA
jgi:type III pantothenate kinase